MAPTVPIALPFCQTIIIRKGTLIQPIMNAWCLETIPDRSLELTMKEKKWKSPSSKQYSKLAFCEKTIKRLIMRTRSIFEQIVAISLPLIVHISISPSAFANRVHPFLFRRDRDSKTLNNADIVVPTICPIDPLVFCLIRHIPPFCNMWLDRLQRKRERVCTTYFMSSFVSRTLWNSFETNIRPNPVYIAFSSRDHWERKNLRHSALLPLLLLFPFLALAWACLTTLGSIT